MTDVERENTMTDELRAATRLECLRLAVSTYPNEIAVALAKEMTDFVIDGTVPEKSVAASHEERMAARYQAQASKNPVGAGQAINRAYARDPK